MLAPCRDVSVTLPMLSITTTHTTKTWEENTAPQELRNEEQVKLTPWKPPRP